MVEFEMIFDKTITKALFKHQIKKLVWLYVLMVIMLEVCAGCFWFCGYKTFAVCMIVLSIVYVPICLLFSYAAQKHHNKSLVLLDPETKERFKFSDDFVEITRVKSIQFVSKIKTRYFYFKKVVETDKHYFLYVSQSESYVIAKASLKSGNLEELNKILSANLGRRFVKE